MKTEERKLIDDRFTVKDINPQGKHFKNVSRVHMVSKYNIQLELDINTSIFPVEKNNSFLVLIVRKVGERNIFLPDELNKPQEKDDYDYVCYGTVFEIKNEETGMAVYASFGGLLMRLWSEEDKMSVFSKDPAESRIYLKLKKS